MDFVETYLTKHNFQPLLTDDPQPGLNICIVIPSYNEPDLLRSMEALYNCMPPLKPAEVIIVINSPETSDKSILEQNLATFHEASEWIQKHLSPKLRFHLIHCPDLPEKSAGVGLARKIGMDEAAYRFHKIGNELGIIAGFDADSTCETNYLVELENHFQKFTETTGASIYFEHPIAGLDYEPIIYEGIIRYELHLRYMNQAMRYAGHPHAFHTVGSSFAVRMDEYVKQGGMNKRQAGEDFYFLQKLISPGNYSEINSTCIMPSPRVSDRVVFGTGASMQRWLTEKKMETYPMDAYNDIKLLIDKIDGLYTAEPEAIRQMVNDLPHPLQGFLNANNFTSEWKSIMSNSASHEAFRKRFFRWFNAFKVIKYLNFSVQHFYEKSEVIVEAGRLVAKLGFNSLPDDSKNLLIFYRYLDKSGFGIRKNIRI